MIDKKMVVLFDGVCTLCTGSIRFVLRRDPHGNFMFASLQSEKGQELLKKHGLSTEDFDSVVLIKGDKYYLKSDAALTIAQYMSGFYWLLAIFFIIPRPIRDFFYNLIANHRYEWFGKKDSCPVPTPEERARFIDDKKDLEEQLQFDSENSEKPPRRPYPWPLKLMVALLVFDMCFRSIFALTPATDEWQEKLALKEHPKALPTQREFRQIDEGNHPEDYSSKGSRTWASVKDALRFMAPWPSEESQDKIDGALDALTYSITWLYTRLDFVGHLVGVDQDWPMFSPNVNKSRTETLARCKLVYKDGSTKIVRVGCDPEDLTDFGYFNSEKRLGTAYKVHRDTDSRLGYCNMLSHKYSKNEEGSPLVKILVYRVHYKYPAPDDDPYQFLKEQTGPPADQIDKPFWYYDVKEKEGYYLKGGN